MYDNVYGSRGLTGHSLAPEREILIKIILLMGSGDIMLKLFMQIIKNRICLDYSVYLVNLFQW